MSAADRISADDQGPARFRVETHETVAGRRTIIDFGGEQLSWIAFDRRSLSQLIETLKAHLEILEQTS